MFTLAMVQFVQVCCQVKMSRYCMIFIKLRRVEAAFQLCQTYSCEPLVLERLWVSIVFNNMFNSISVFLQVVHIHVDN